MIHRAEELFQKKVPLIELMNTMKEVKSYVPTI
jgi:hypothetical protein